MAGYKEYFTVEYRNDQRVVVLNDTLKSPTRKSNEQDNNSTERNTFVESIYKRQRNSPLL